MGDRALIQLTTKDGDVSPVLYLHWGGSDVANILQRAQEQMKGRANDLSYAFARLVQQAINGDGHNTGYGVWNHASRLTESDSHGDAGCFVIDVTTEAWSVAQGGGYGLGGEHSFPVIALQVAA
jgi:hypothetical protein